MLLLIILALLDLTTQIKITDQSLITQQSSSERDTMQRVVPPAHIEKLRSQIVDVLPHLVGCLQSVLEKAVLHRGDRNFWSRLLQQTKLHGRGSRLLLALSVIIFDEVLKEVHALFSVYLVDFDQILRSGKTQSCQSNP